MNIRARRAQINFVTKDDMLFALKNSQSKDEVLRKLGFRSNNNNRIRVEERCKELCLKWPDFPKGLGHNKGKKFGFRFPIEHYAIKNGKAGDRKMILYQLVERGIRPYQCEVCGLKGEWNGKPLTLQLHHINGINNDNRLENVQIICPNCHSQSDFFRGRNVKH